MKAVVVDIEGKYAVVLAKNGSFIKVKNSKEYKVGHEIDISSNKPVNLFSYTKIASMAAAILIFIGIGIGAHAYNSPYSYINVDINPSVEITTNVFDRIIDIKALNTDGEKVIAHGSYKNHKIKDGIDELLKSAVDEGYLRKEKVEGDTTIIPENAVMFTVSSKNEGKVPKIEEEIKAVTNDELKASKVISEVVVENVSLEKHNKAEGNHMSPGKILLLERLQQAVPDIKAEDYKNAPVRDILKIIKTEKAKDKEPKKNSVKKNSSTNVIDEENIPNSEEVKPGNKNKDKQKKNEIQSNANKADKQKYSGNDNNNKLDKNKKDSSTGKNSVKDKVKGKETSPSKGKGDSGTIENNNKDQVQKSDKGKESSGDKEQKAKRGETQGFNIKANEGTNNSTKAGNKMSTYNKKNKQQDSQG
jgi:hypothetical protein